MMRHYFYQFSQSIITVIWWLLFGLMFFFAITSPNIILGDNKTFGTSTTLLSTSIVIVMTAILIMIYAYPQFRHGLYHVLITNQLRTAGFLLGLVVIGQIVFVAFVHPPAGFDAGMLHYAATNAHHVQEVEVTAYYSLNQNNLPVMLFMHWLVKLTGQTSWLFFDYVTLFFVDLSACFNLLSVFVVRRQSLGIALYIHAAWLAVFPSIIMPYTDSWGLPLVSLFLLCYFVMRRIDLPPLLRISAAVVFGISVMITYFVKPSSIIPVIAIVIIESLIRMSSRRSLHSKTIFITVAMLILMVGSAGFTYRYVNNVVQNQDYIQIDKTRSIPAVHFMAMGVYGDGGYNAKQALRMAALPTKQQKTAYSIKMLKRRLHQLRPVGYLKFLVKKQRNNTADGTFGWLKEGGFFHDNQQPNNHGFSNKLKNFVYLYGRHIADFRFIAQLWWITLLTIIMLGFGTKSWVIQVLRLSMVGGFIFLLLFEGGRSRYLIQYLPCILLLGAFSFDGAIANVQRVVKWYQDKLKLATAADKDG